MIPNTYFAGCLLGITCQMRCTQNLKRSGRSLSPTSGKESAQLAADESLVQRVACSRQSNHGNSGAPKSVLTKR